MLTRTLYPGYGHLYRVVMWDRVRDRRGECTHLVLRAAPLGRAVVTVFACGGAGRGHELYCGTYEALRHGHHRVCRRCAAALRAGGEFGPLGMADEAKIR